MKALLSVLVMLGLVGVPAFSNDYDEENTMERVGEETESMVKDAKKATKKAAKKAKKATKKEWNKAKKTVEEKTEGAMQEEGAM
jgi:hypothetical protein